MVVKYKIDTIPTLERQVRGMEDDRNRLSAQAAELAEINREIAELSEHVDTVKGLYRKRYVWAKTLSDIKHIVNFDSTMSSQNSDMRYIWCTTLNCYGNTIALNGFATASERNVAFQLPGRLTRTFETYVPVSLPEKDEEVRLQKELAAAINAYENLRRENPELPYPGPEEIEVRQRLEALKAIKSGGIALEPFYSLVVPGSLRVNRITWTAAPQPNGRSQDAANFPTQAWSFDLNLVLKTPE